MSNETEPTDTATSTPLITLYETWQGADATLASRIIAAIGETAYAVLTEPQTGPTAALNAAQRLAWARIAGVNPGRYERNARWAVVLSAAYAENGATLSDTALRTIVAAAVDALAAL